MNVIESFKLDGKVAIVTGGYSHLGEAFSIALLEAGATVIVAGRDEKKFNEKFSNCYNCYFEPIDIMDSGSMKRCFERVIKRFKSIDILVNSATTVQGSQFFEEMTDEDWGFSMDGVAGCVFKACREVTPFMKEKGGSIINIASMYGYVVPDFRIYEGEYRYQFNPLHYGAAKAAVIHMSKYLAEYLIGDKIRVNVISPGPFPSKETQRHKEFIKRLSEKNPMNRIGVPEDLKGALVFLASDASKYVIGQNIQVDGGWSIW